MKFLLDQSVSAFVGDALKADGHDAVHTSDYGMQRADDVDILARADQENRVLLCVDTDFGTLLAQSKAAQPSIILFRGSIARSYSLQIQVLRLNLATIEADLLQGSIVIIDDNKMRVRNLPLP